MTVNSDNAFDYERFPEDLFTAVATGENGIGRSGTVLVRLKILDVNDEPVDLRLVRIGLPYSFLLYNNPSD